MEFKKEYSFFTAGHVYGKAGIHLPGMYQPFVDQIPYLNNYKELEFGILTGDVVPVSTEEYWNAAEARIKEFDFPIHIAPGNHDRGSIFDDRFDSYYSFVRHNDLFIILSPTEWNIEGQQKDFLIKTLEENSDLVTNIFIFCHELIWWAPDNKFSGIKINYKPYYPGSTNYWDEIDPILKAYDNDFVIYAGDLGATDAVTPYMYYQYENITLIASGMGGGKEDNIIITEVNSIGDLNFKLLGINSPVPVELEPLEEYELP